MLARREHWDLEGANFLGGGRSPSLVRANEKVEAKSGLCTSPSNWTEGGLEHTREDTFWFRQCSSGFEHSGAGGRGQRGSRECTGVKAVRRARGLVGDGVSI